MQSIGLGCPPPRVSPFLGTAASALRSSKGFSHACKLQSAVPGGDGPVNPGEGSVLLDPWPVPPDRTDWSSA